MPIMSRNGCRGRSSLPPQARRLRNDGHTCCAAMDVAPASSVRLSIPRSWIRGRGFAQGWPDWRYELGLYRHVLRVDQSGRRQALRADGVRPAADRKP